MGPALSRPHWAFQGLRLSRFGDFASSRLYLRGANVIIPLFLGLIWAVFDSRKQGWHDRIASTVVIRPA